MAQAQAQHYITEAEYWALEETAEEKHEYFDGCIYAMSGGSHAHALLATNALVALANRLRGGPWRAIGSDQRVKIEASGLHTYPDVSVFCQPASFDGNQPDTLLNPSVLIEVLSPSTSAYDKGAKFDEYKKLTSLTDYLLISQDKVQVEHYHRLGNGDWLLHSAIGADEAIDLSAVGCDLPLADIYDGVPLQPIRQPLRPS